MGTIPTPTRPNGGERFLGRGIAALDNELVQLRRLDAPGSFRPVLGATAGELAALNSALKGLRAGNDPVVTIRTLQQQLAPVEARAAEAWQALEIPACVNR